MIARTHDLAAFTALNITFLIADLPQLSLTTVIFAIIANLAGGVTPDIDQPTAPLWRNLPVGKYLGKVFDKVSGGHRFITHSIIGIALLSYLFYLLLKFLHPLFPSVNTDIILISFIIGICSHVFMDAFTKEGVPLFLPLSLKIGIPPIKRLRITTDKLVEKLIIFPVLVIFNLYLLSSHYGVYIDFFRHITK